MMGRTRKAKCWCVTIFLSFVSGGILGGLMAYSYLLMLSPSMIFLVESAAKNFFAL